MKAVESGREGIRKEKELKERKMEEEGKVRTPLKFGVKSSPINYMLHDNSVSDLAPIASS